MHGSSDHMEHRKLRTGMRPVQNVDDPLGFCSAADSRLTVYPTVEAAHTFWYAFPPMRCLTPLTAAARTAG